MRLADGTEIGPDAVIAATGYRRGLEPLVGHLGVLDGRGRPVVHGARTPPGAPGLYFTGFTNPISGMFREMAIDARRIARRRRAARRAGDRGRRMRWSLGRVNRRRRGTRTDIRGVHPVTATAGPATGRWRTTRDISAATAHNAPEEYQTTS